MKCTEFKASYAELILGKGWHSAGKNYDRWVAHMNSCQTCSDWYLQRQLEDKGINIDDFPCVHIAYHSAKTCTKHESAWECPDTTLVCTDGLFGIPVRDGGESYIKIDYCPWCGIDLYSDRG